MADYNINAVTRRVVFTGSAGVGPYSFTFEVLDENDLAVYFNTTKLTLTTDYTVSIAANGTGSVTIVVGTNVPTTPDADDTIIIVGARDIERTTDFVTAGDLRASALNEQLDGLTIFDQQIAEEQKRTLQAPVYDPAHVDDGGTLDMTLPAKAARAGKYLQFNSTTGNPEAGPDSTDVTALADIATDIATLADIEDGTDATDAIQTVAGIAANVTTVAGIAANVSTVAGIQSDVTAVAADATDIGTVATNIASVNTVAGNISEVIAVANDLNEAVSEVETVANDLNEAVSEIETVAASISNVDTVGTNIADVNTVAGIDSNVTTVAGISANVTTVAGISGNVTTVAGISSDVTTVAADGTDIGTVATNIANVNSVAGNATNINNVAGNATNINTVAGISADVTTVAGDSADIQAVAADATDIGTVSSNIADVNTVAGSIANVNTTAANITGVNSFAERYRVGVTDPTTSLDEGDLFFNTTDNTYKFYDGSSWQTVNVSGIGSVLDDATPQLGGNLDTNGNDINFGDNDKAIFGAGSDLQIYHTGSTSYIYEQGTGDLRIRGSQVRIEDDDGSTLALFKEDAGVELRYDGAVKLESTATGVDVTGTVTADEFVADSAGTLGNSQMMMDFSAPNGRLQVKNSSGAPSANMFFLTTDGAGNTRNRVKVDDAGDFVLYADDGTTEGFFWDASTQRLGLGTTSPATTLDVQGGNITQGATGSNAGRFLIDNTTDTIQRLKVSRGGSTGQLAFHTGADTEAMRIDSSANVGIGTSLPIAQSALTVGGGQGSLSVTGSDGNFSAGGQRTFMDFASGKARIGGTGGGGAGTTLGLYVGTGTEAMNVTAAGLVGIGKTPSTALDVNGTVTATAFSGDGSGLTGVSAGKVLQVVTAVDSTTTAVTSGSDVTVHSVTITPSSTSSKVLILASYTGYIGGAGSTERFTISLKRGTTVLADSEMYRDSGHMKAVPSQFNHLDSPSTTSARTYNITIRRISGGDSFGWCEGGKEAVLTALEISS